MRLRLPLRPSAALASALFTLVTAAPTATAQTEAGIARDPSTQAPLACLHVSLVDSTGTAVAHTVTDSLGQFYLDAPKPGVYRARFETYGWAPLNGPLDTLATDAEFKQRAYPVVFTDVVRATSLDSLPHKIIPWKKRFDKATNDSIFAPQRRLAEEARRREASTGWISRRIDTHSANIRYPEGLRRGQVEGAAVVRFIVDSTGRPRRESWSVVKASHEAFAQALRRLLDFRWTPSSHAGQPVCDLVQYYVRFGFDTDTPQGNVAMIVIMNE